MVFRLNCNTLSCFVKKKCIHPIYDYIHTLHAGHLTINHRASTLCAIIFWLMGHIPSADGNGTLTSIYIVTAWIIEYRTWPAIYDSWSCRFCYKGIAIETKELSMWKWYCVDNSHNRDIGIWYSIYSIHRHFINFMCRCFIWFLRPRDDFILMATQCRGHGYECGSCPQTRPWPCTDFITNLLVMV